MNSELIHGYVQLLGLVELKHFGEVTADALELKDELFIVSMDVGEASFQIIDHKLPCDYRHEPEVMIDSMSNWTDELKLLVGMYAKACAGIADEVYYNCYKSTYELVIVHSESNVLTVEFQVG